MGCAFPSKTTAITLDQPCRKNERSSVSYVPKKKRENSSISTSYTREKVRNTNFHHGFRTSSLRALRAASKCLAEVGACRKLKVTSER